MTSKGRSRKVNFPTAFALVVGTAGLVLIIMHSISAAALLIASAAYVGFFVVVLRYFDVFGKKEDVPMCNMKKVP